MELETTHKGSAFLVLIEQLQKIAQLDSKTVEPLFAMLPQRAPELWRKLVVGAYLDDQINLGKAAQMLGKHPIELRREFLKEGIPIKIGVESIAEAKSDADALKRVGNSG